VSRSPIEPMIVTSSPSRIQTVPNPMITIQCHFAQGRRSRRAGTLVSISLPSAGMVASVAIPEESVPRCGLINQRHG
jgi:hypothetical protein